MDNQWEIIRNLDSMTIRELLDLLRQTTLLPISGKTSNRSLSRSMAHMRLIE